MADNKNIQQTNADAQDVTNADAQDVTNADAQDVTNADAQDTTNTDVQSTTTSETQNTNGENSDMGKKQEKMVSIFIPKESRGDTERFVAVNGERLLIQTGKTVEVPERFAEVIKNSQSMAAVAAEFIDQNISNS